MSEPEKKKKTLNYLNFEVVFSVQFTWLITNKQLKITKIYSVTFGERTICPWNFTTCIVGPKWFRRNLEKLKHVIKLKHVKQLSIPSLGTVKRRKILTTSIAQYILAQDIASNLLIKYFFTINCNNNTKSQYIIINTFFTNS